MADRPAPADPSRLPRPEAAGPPGWKPLLMADLRQQAVRRPWGLAVMAVGVVHLGFFLVNQAFYTAGSRSEGLFLGLWVLEVASVVATMRLVAGRGWLTESSAVGLIVRVWVTFLILSFNAASLNTLTGWSIDWFKLVWCTLSSFGFATMAWLFGLRFLVPAFQMYFTGLLIFRFPQWAYLIHGVSWCAALQWIGVDLYRRRARLRAEDPAPHLAGDPGFEAGSASAAA